MQRWTSAIVLFSVVSTAHATSAIWTVTSTGSGGACTPNSTSDSDCTLDAAITAAGNGDVVEFATTVQGQAIALAEQTITVSLTIDASPGGVALDGGGANRLLDIASGATVTFSHLTLRNGAAGSAASGGAIYNDGILILDSCTLAHNSAGIYGGAVYNDGTLTITNSTIADNTAPSGGGIFNSSTLIIGNSTIAGNAAASGSGLGGGLYLTSGYELLLSDLIAGNTAGNGPDIFANVSTLLYSRGNNLIGDGTDSNLTSQSSDQVGTAASPVDPRFVAAGLADYGGATPTIALQSSSPAFKNGKCSGSSTPPYPIPGVIVDQRGLPRAPAACTIGAFDLNEIFADNFEG
jgi:hypothetical protein